MARPLTNKHIKFLAVLFKVDRVIAAWGHSELSDLTRMGLVTFENGFRADGKLSAHRIWSITPAGMRFLTEERAGQ